MASELTELIPEPLHILLVEDDDQLRESLREVLVEEGYQVVAVPSGTEAIARSSQQKFDLIVTDIKTPGTDGLSALEKVKEGNPEVAGIVITGYSTEEFALRAARLRVENYLKKPFPVDEFLLTVDRLAEKKREEQRTHQREVTVQRAFRWLLLQSAESQPQLGKRSIEDFLETVVLAAPVSPRELREQLALENLSLLCLLKKADWPGEFNAVFPPRIQQALKLAAPSPLLEHLQSNARLFLDGKDLIGPDPEDNEGEDTASLPASLLNMALLLESTERISQAKLAFENLLEQVDDPYERFAAHFGLARISRLQRRFEDLDLHLHKALEQAMSLGPLTHGQALVERGILLAQARADGAEAALKLAKESARRLKDTGTFALASLALACFFDSPAPQELRLLSYLARSEQFPLAMESSEWLLAYLLSKDSLAPEARRFLTKLVRSCPKSFEDLVLHSQETQTLINSLPYLDVLESKNQERIQQRFQSLESPELREQLARRSLAHQQSALKNSTLRIFSFSGIRVFRDDQALEISRKKPLLLLLYLLYRNGPVGEESLAELFWPGPEEKAKASLRTALSYLRKLLVPEGVQEPFSRQAGGLALAEEVSVWFDYREFERLVKRGRSFVKNHPERTMECYRTAVKLYRGPFLENIYEEWALSLREQTEVLFEECLHFLARESVSAQNWGEALEHSSRGIRRDPLSQPFCESAMRAMLELGRHHDALQLFEQCKTALQKELDMEPSIEMIKLRELARLNL